MAERERVSYRQFIDVDEKYFPCIDDSAIDAGASWEDTYPHETFIAMLKDVERMLNGNTRRSVWIHGAYGTGKSKCAFALKKILEVSNEELENYWNHYEALRRNKDLLAKLEGHKSRGIITPYRYASGDITTPRDLFFSIQESIRESLKGKVEYLGENTLKESVIAWIEDPAHKDFLNRLLQKPEWQGAFAQSTADEILRDLKKQNVRNLMANIFRLADKEGITAMSLDADKLKRWIKDLIIQNDIKIVFIWDEFSGFFKQNRNSLDEFQKIVALCQEVPFYFVVVTHQTENIINADDDAWKVVRQRFNFSMITLPDNVAFELIGHAIDVKEAAKDTWKIYADDLNSRLDSSRTAVMEETKISDPEVMKKMLPIQPMTAYVLKNIASSFQANQRSMFDFIKTRDTDDTQAFQWFIENFGPEDDHPLFTVDMLWDFFYEKGRNDLSESMRMILDVYDQQKGNLREDEQRVLKTILIMQALDKGLGGVLELLKSTERNLSYAFEGITSGLDISCKGIAKGLMDKGILIQTPIGKNQFAYGVAVLAGDQNRIEENKKKARDCSTAQLVSDGDLGTVLQLTPPLRLRFGEDARTGEMITVTTRDFKRVLNGMKDNKSPWHMNAVVAFAKDEGEAIAFRREIRAAAQNEEYRDIVIIDALSTPLGKEDFEKYIEYAAMAMYYQGNNNEAANENKKKANQVLSIEWKNRIYNGSFFVYYDGCPEGEKAVNGEELCSILQKVTAKKHRYLPDFVKGVNQNQLLNSHGKVSAEAGALQKTKLVVKNLENLLLPEVWKEENYWEKPATEELTISEIKRNLDRLIGEAFDREGQISIGEIYDYLETQYGFPPSNLSAFLTGFLLKEYRTDPYRYADQNGSHESMTPGKLGEMIGNYLDPTKKAKPTYIVKMTPEEKKFYKVTEEAWGITPNSCTSASQAGILVKNKMQELGLPVWSLAGADRDGIYDIVEKYIKLVQKEGDEAHKIALSIGGDKRAEGKLGEQLKKLLTRENCKRGILIFLEKFEEGKLLKLTENIGARDNLISDISRLFSVEYSSLWRRETGEDQLRKLIVDYRFVKETNRILYTDARSKQEAFDKWEERLKFVQCSKEALEGKYPDLNKIWDFLLRIYQKREILPEQMKEYTEELEKKSDALSGYLNTEADVFAEIYAPYLEELSREEIGQMKNADFIGIFAKSRTESNAIVKTRAEEFRKNLKKTRLFNLWQEKTSTKTPRDWSERQGTPILNVIGEKEYDKAKKTFEVLNRNGGTGREIENALEYLEKTDIFNDLRDEDKVQEGFRKLLGRYQTILEDWDSVRRALNRLSIDAYEWNEHPLVKEKIGQLAKAEYEAGGSDKVAKKIENMSSDELKTYLIKSVRENMNLGIEILNGGE